MQISAGITPLEDVAVPGADNSRVSGSHQKRLEWEWRRQDESSAAYMGTLGPMGMYGPIPTLWNGGADQLKFPADQLKLHGCSHFTKETCVCGFKMSKKWSFGPIRNDARPIVAAGRPRMQRRLHLGGVVSTLDSDGSSSEKAQAIQFRNGLGQQCGDASQKRRQRLGKRLRQSAETVQQHEGVSQ